MSDNVSDLIGTVVAAAAFAVAVTMLLFMSHILSEEAGIAAKAIDDKQSIRTQQGTDIDTLPAHRTPAARTASEAYTAILAIDEQTTEVTISGSTVSKADITAAKNGDERAASRIRNKLGNSKWLVASVYDTGPKGDYIWRLTLKTA